MMDEKNTTILNQRPSNRLIIILLMGWYRMQIIRIMVLIKTSCSFGDADYIYLLILYNCKQFYRHTAYCVCIFTRINIFVSPPSTSVSVFTDGKIFTYRNFRTQRVRISNMRRNTYRKL